MQKKKAYEENPKLYMVIHNFILNINTKILKFELLKLYHHELYFLFYILMF